MCGKNIFGNWGRQRLQLNRMYSCNTSNRSWHGWWDLFGGLWTFRRWYINVKAFFNAIYSMISLLKLGKKKRKGNWICFCWEVLRMVMVDCSWIYGWMPWMLMKNTFLIDIFPKTKIDWSFNMCCCHDPNPWNVNLDAWITCWTYITP